MEYIIELLAELIGNITGKCEPSKMPDGFEYKSSFTVKPYPKNTILWIFGEIACFLVALIAYFGNGIAFASVFLVCGILLLVIGLAQNTRKYKIDDKKIIRLGLFSRKKVFYWNSVRYVKLFEFTNDSNVTLALYDEKKLLVDFVSPQKNFWCIQKMAEHLEYSIIIEKDPSFKKILAP